MSEDKEFFIRAKTDNLLPEDDTFTKQDPFNQSWDVIKDLQGLDANFKRRTSRIVKGEATQGYIDSSREQKASVLMEQDLKRLTQEQYLEMPTDSLM